MFDKTKIAELEQSIGNLKSEIERIQFKYDEKNHDYKVLSRDMALQIESGVDEEVKSIKAKNIKLENENTKLETETKMLNKAFDEIGFDVKDSKDLMVKLIEAISKKADVKIVK